MTESNLNIDPAGSSGEMMPIDEGFSFKTLGLEQNTAAFLAYFFGWGCIGGIVFFLISGKNKFVKFAALQSIIFNAVIVAAVLLATLLSGGLAFLIRNMGMILSLLLMVGVIGIIYLWILLLIDSFNGKERELPIIGKVARNIIK